MRKAQAESCLMALAVLALGAMPVLAGTPAETSVHSSLSSRATAQTEPLVNDYTSTVLRLAGIRIAKLRVYAGDYTPQERSYIVKQRLQLALGRPLTDGRVVETATLNGEAVVLLNGQHLLTVTLADAKANHTTPDKLAQLWAAQLQRAADQISWL